MKIKLAGTVVAVASTALLATGCAAVALIAIVTWRRLSRDQANRRNAAMVADPLLVGAPLLASFLFWAIASWIIVGHPFEQFSSAYGNAALVETGGGKAAINPTLIVMQWLVLAPALIPPRARPKQQRSFSSSSAPSQIVSAPFC